MDAPRQGWRRVTRALRWVARWVLRWALRPQVILLVIVGAALLTALLALNDARVALRHVLNFPPALLALYVALMLAYETVRTAQWLVWLRALDVRAPLRVRVFAFLAGEGGQLLPAGNFLRTYLLRQMAGTPYSAGVPATTATLWMEDVIALVGVIVLGVPGWGWLRPAASGVLVAFAIIAALIYWVVRVARQPAWLGVWMGKSLARYPRLVPLVEQGSQVREAAGLLGRPRVLLAQAGLCAAYLAFGGAAFFTILQGLGLHQLTLAEGQGVYAFSLAVGLLAPLPLDLGVIEASGVGALVACGVDPGVAVAAMLLQRALSSGVAMLVAAGAAVVYGSERRAAFAGIASGMASDMPSAGARLERERTIERAREHAAERGR